MWSCRPILVYSKTKQINKFKELDAIISNACMWSHTNETPSQRQTTEKITPINVYHLPPIGFFSCVYISLVFNEYCAFIHLWLMTNSTIICKMRQRCVRSLNKSCRFIFCQWPHAKRDRYKITVQNFIHNIFIYIVD